MKRKKLKPKKTTFEYLLIVSQKYDELKKKQFSLFRLQTVQEFTNFRYELVVEEEIRPGEIKYKIVGIDTPQLLIPGGGNAFHEKSYTQLSGEYKIEIVNLDGISNIFTIKISKDKIKLVDSQQKSFVDIEIK
jgi:hypothetical protein